MNEDWDQYDRVGVIGIVMRGDRALVIQRSEKVPAPLTWCLPGGGIEPGESQEDAVRRELREELGIEVTPVRCVYRSVTPWNVLLFWWTAAATDTELENLNPNPDEVRAVRWMTLAELRDSPDTLLSNRDAAGIMLQE